MTQNSTLLISDNRGIYIPKLFAENYAHYLTNREELKADLLEVGNPDNEYYCDSWETILDNARLKDDEGRICILHQDGDLWAIPENEVEEIPETC